MRKTLQFLTVLVALLFLVACEPQNTEPVKNGTQKTLVIVSGGLGSDQTTDLYIDLCQKCPNAEVISAGNWDGYKADFIGLVNKYREDPEQKVVFIGHSFGGEAVNKATIELQDKVEYLVFIDPVAQNWGNFNMANNIGTYDYFLRTDWFGPRTAQIPGAAYTSVKGGHNTIPHDAYLIDMVVQHINTIE